ncbi:MAG: folate/biopterin family MFS transporter [Trichodesmium sp. St16_bin4-tuft]|uniref:Folate/biopterin transporter n=1 Tax=Trichodesmium erythraeum (strain IMS101) TaxID=203124 RepID=Q10ZJ4_TRIEI|nr:folate/biopterin family MFS transporter [Trichodesmium erythraeum GBRTRLIN201]MDE5073403.1 folate/biopterin family MFS transporter [Trichodesmium sp. St5_bin8]MDE5077377.1 folate/biopterin family MFS transporter [Trichodesmium sp. St2_bin6]MDE5092786.1 folate/biopterin family MFS transporter [Trichodesmium sp. St11_bin5]MDE5097238.1 folate/biopterin family MFS transporter [Trichodesmium sp. St16_bin4-tuft]MDE5104897.1 folate/biopterin family MFS transporter [Trichodesmium sp. St19_bin2]
MFISSEGIIKLQKYFKQKVFFGNEPTPELIAILLVYFVQGILGLGSLAISFFLKDELAMTPAEVSAMLGIVIIPWMIKPLFGFITDGVPILGYRRGPYIIFSGILGAFSWVALATWVDTPLTATVAIAMSSLSVAMSDVIIDSLVVERVQKESVSNTGSLQSLCWSASALGGLITAYFSGYLLEHFSPQTVFLITATFPLIVSLVPLLIEEKKVSIRINFDNVKQQIKQVKKAVIKKSILLPTAFLVIWQATPNSESAFFFFSTNELGFQAEFLGRIRLVTSIAALFGVWLFQRFFKSVPFRKIFGWSTVISALLGMTTLLLVTHTNRTLGIDDHWFSLGDSLVLTVMGKIAFMPVLVLAARLCPPGVEATVFALLMSIYNLAALISHEGGALLMHWLKVTETNFDNLWLLIVITNLSTLLPLPLLNWLPTANAQTDEEENLNSQPILEPESSEIISR